jgi:hypothetical protein
MAVVAFTSDQLAPEGTYAKRLLPVEDHGKLRLQYFYFKNLTGAVGDAGSTIDLVNLPPGRVRLLPIMAALRKSAFGAARVASFGNRAYSKGASQVLVPEDNNDFSAGIDLAAAGNLIGTFMGTQIKYDLYSVAGITVFATITGGTVPVDAELEGYIPYVYE